MFKAISVEAGVLLTFALSLAFTFPYIPSDEASRFGVEANAAVLSALFFVMSRFISLFRVSFKVARLIRSAGFVVECLLFLLYAVGVSMALDLVP